MLAGCKVSEWQGDRAKVKERSFTARRAPTERRFVQDDKKLRPAWRKGVIQPSNIPTFKSSNVFYGVM
jgi:hypothetical protein